VSHKHYCGVTGHEWQCSDSTCICICGEPMEVGDHSQCYVELRDCPEHHEQLPESPDDELCADVLRDLPPNAGRPRCQCGCANANHEQVVGFCVWCNHVYVSYDAKTESQHFSKFCTGAPTEIREAAQSRLTRLD